MDKEKLYGIIKNVNVENEELHIIKVKIYDYDRNGKPIYVAVTEKCIYKRLKYNERKPLEKSVGNEVNMRYLCAERGWQVCGTRVSSLYDNFLEN